MDDMNAGQVKKPKIPLLERKSFTYFFMFSILLYMLISGYILYFSGSVFIEGIANGWYKAGADPSDDYALWWSFLTSFPCLMSVLGGVAVLSTNTNKFHNVKILMFTPSLVWSAQLVIGNFRWGLTYWQEWLHLVPLMIFCAVMLYCVVKRVRIPILAVKPGRGASALDAESS
jgi:hypothetical protein